jgi:hypothetical protein
MNDKAKQLGETLVNAVTIENEDGSQTVHGLSLREHFAGVAMQGLCSGQADYAGWGINPATVVKMAIEAADALLAELSKEEWL